jgi:molecular chaperone DnaK
LTTISAFAKLKEWAEDAKIALSNERSESIQKDFVCNDDLGIPVALDFVLKRDDVESVFRPLLYRSIELCRRVLSEAKLSASHIERIILVGGPTYTPFLRELLADRKEGLGIPVDFSADPLTVVAQGAAIFASANRLPTAVSATSTPGAYTVSLSYDPVGNDPEPFIGGAVSGPSKGGLAEFTIKFLNPASKPPWESGRIPLDQGGAFTCSLLAREGAMNQFRIELFDPNGRPCIVSPSTLNYTIGLTINAPPLTHNIGIAEAGNRMHILFKKGTPLPAKTKVKHVTVRLIRHGNADDALKIPLVEGEATEAADENREIGEFKLTGNLIDRDLPSGSEVEIRVEINDSRTINWRVYIPILDYEKDISTDGLVKSAHAVGVIQEQFQSERNALAESRELAEATESTLALNELEAINRQEFIQGIDRMLRNGSTDTDLKNCEEQVVALRRARRRIEMMLSAHKMRQEAEGEILWAQALLEQVGTDDDRGRFAELKRQLEVALGADAVILRTAIDALSKLRVELWLRTHEYWLGYREYLAAERDRMLDTAQADRWLVHAERAVASGDFEALKSACRQLHSLLPKDEQTGYGGTTVRAR